MSAVMVVPVEFWQFLSVPYVFRVDPCTSEMSVQLRTEDLDPRRRYALEMSDER